MSDEGENDESYLDRYHHHMMDYYQSPFLTVPSRRRSAPGVGSLVVVLVLIYTAINTISTYWENILVFLLPLAGFLGMALLLGLIILVRTSLLREAHETVAPARAAKAAANIRDTINSSSDLKRYFWSADDAKLIEQWRRFHEEGVKPIRRNKVVHAGSAATLQPKAPLFSPEAQKILALIDASPKLSRHAWHSHETGLLEQWQRYQTRGQLPIRRRKLEKILARGGVNPER